jgi:hypothetical protein
LNEIADEYPNTGSIDMNNKKIVNVADGVNPTDSITKRQLDVVANKLIVSSNG